MPEPRQPEIKQNKRGTEEDHPQHRCKTSPTFQDGKRHSNEEMKEQTVS